MKRSKSQAEQKAPTWEMVRSYIQHVCQDLPYTLHLEHHTSEAVAAEAVRRKPMVVAIRPPYDEGALRIPVSNSELGIEGEIAIVSQPMADKVNEVRVKESQVSIRSEERSRVGLDESAESVLLRGGFRIGGVPGLPNGYGGAGGSARLRLTWHNNENKRFKKTNLARSSVAGVDELYEAVSQVWIKYLLEHRGELSEGFVYGLGLDRWLGFRREGRRMPDIGAFAWLEGYGGLALYELARNGWHYFLKYMSFDLTSWETGEKWALMPTYHFYSGILQLLLPHIVAERMLTREGKIYLSPPQPGWREMLERNNNFVSQPVKWPVFVKYEESISKFVFHSWGDDQYFFNQKFASALSGFTSEELFKMAEVLKKLCYEKRYKIPTELNGHDGSLLGRFVAEAGDLQIGSLYGESRMDSFTPKSATMASS